MAALLWAWARVGRRRRRRCKGHWGGDRRRRRRAVITIIVAGARVALDVSVGRELPEPGIPAGINCL